MAAVRWGKGKREEGPCVEYGVSEAERVVDCGDGFAVGGRGVGGARPINLLEFLLFSH